MHAPAEPCLWQAGTGGYGIRPYGGCLAASHLPNRNGFFGIAGVGSGRSTQRESSVTAPTRPMNIVRIRTTRLAGHNSAVMPVESPAVL